LVVQGLGRLAALDGSASISGAKARRGLRKPGETGRALVEAFQAASNPLFDEGPFRGDGGPGKNA
jgi:hypothetical protein